MLRNEPVLLRVAVSIGLGVVAAVVVGVLGEWSYAPPVGWSTAAFGFVVWTWLAVRHMSAAETASHATREDPTRHITQLILVLASLGSVGGVAYLLMAQSTPSGDADLAAALGLSSVVGSWLLVHTVFTLRYALLYYSEPPKPVDFNQDDNPVYADFAYLALTLGMTYQVSDTDLRTRTIRATALRQALLSYLLGAVVLGVTINLIAGLGHSSS
jgi:uncharacterized membrane protein